ncbi:hypothetical protein F9K73_11425 [Brucella intermedia]|nr:hypothetical protein F9K73_11425 [Brucella intermedia]
MKILNCSELGKPTGYHYIIPANCNTFNKLATNSRRSLQNDLQFVLTTYVLFLGSSNCFVDSLGLPFRSLSSPHETLQRRDKSFMTCPIDIRVPGAICR